jgi:nucleotide-binding universal stress UspA family protein
MPNPAPFRSILVPVDGSRLAEQAIPTALAIAKRSQGKVKLVLVHQLHPLLFMEPGQVYTRTLLAIQKADREYLTGLVERWRAEAGPVFSSALLKGPVAPTLADYARDVGADLVVMTTHGRGGLRRVWLGSVADELVRRLDVPLILVRPSEKGAAAEPLGWGEIVVPLDGSPLAEAVLGPVTALARVWDAEISLVQVVSPVLLTSDPPLPFPTGYADQVTRIRREAAQDYIQDVAGRLRESGVKATGITLVGGGVADTLLGLLRPERVGLLAIATHGRGGVRRLVLGSVADKLVRAAELPVLIVRPRSVPRRSRRSKSTSAKRSSLQHAL